MFLLMSHIVSTGVVCGLTHLITLHVFPMLSLCYSVELRIYFFILHLVPLLSYKMVCRQQRTCRASFLLVNYKHTFGADI